ncbi:hypothetical protein B0H16DRAFT_1725843 [Mycena metata]|uniref:Uncharacterized protein n=1 Tax=Mycena metata TaxID=1033252 RepID=A0AAD7N5S1_9AGAR|nr:hypothetical protein B0H16DRAFT_1725843 [Mycena metata]
MFAGAADVDARGNDLELEGSQLGAVCRQGWRLEAAVFTHQIPIPIPIPPQVQKRTTRFRDDEDDGGAHLPPSLPRGRDADAPVSPVIPTNGAQSPKTLDPRRAEGEECGPRAAATAASTHPAHAGHLDPRPTA